MIRERPDRLQSVEAGQVLLFTGGVSCGSAAVYVRLLLCGSIAVFYVWCTPDMRFRCGVLYLVHVRYTVLLRRFVFDHACCLPPVRQTGRLAGCFVPVPPWVVIAIRAFSDVVRLSNLAGSLRVCAFLYGDPDRERRRRRERGGRGNGIGGAAECAFA